MLVKFSICSVSRLENGTADKLAREALKQYGFQVWVEDHPPYILDVLSFDIYQRMLCFPS